MEPQVRLGPRIIITGWAGSGKTSLGMEIGSLLDRTLIKLDALVLDDKVRRKPQQEIASALEDVAREREWVLEGAPWDVPDHAWKAATTVIWLDFPTRLLAWQLFKRAFPRRLARRRVWGLIRHTLRAHGAERRRIERHVQQAVRSDVQILRLSRPDERRRLIEDVVASTRVPSDRHRSGRREIASSDAEPAD